MKRIRPDYYDKFTCIADQCPTTCCQEWKIAVDDETLRRWKMMTPPDTLRRQRTHLSDYTVKKEGVRVIRLEEDHRCPFLAVVSCRRMEIQYCLRPARFFLGRYMLSPIMRRRR